MAGANKLEDFASVLAADDLAALRALGTVRTFARGQALMHQEQVPHSVLLLHSGRVKVSAIAATGGESVLAFRGPGDLVGELSALDAAPRSATVVAVECVEALVVADHEFRAFLAERPAAAMALLRVLAWRLRDSDAKRIQFAAYTTASRVAARLLALCERFRLARGRGDSHRPAAIPGGTRRVGGLVAWRRSAVRCGRCARSDGSRHAGARSGCSTSRRCAAWGGRSSAEPAA